MEYTLILDGHLKVKAHLSRTFSVGDKFLLNGMETHVVSVLGPEVKLSSAPIPVVIKTPHVRRFAHTHMNRAVNDD